MNRKKTDATASGTAEKRGEKKDENFFSKTAHSIRDKVQEFTDDMKEKTQHLTRSSEPKKNKKDKDQKQPGATYQSSPNPRTVSRKESDSSSDDKDTTKPAPSPPGYAAKKDNERNTSKPGTSGSKPAAAHSTSLKPPSNKLALTNKPLDEHKDAGATSSADSSRRNSAEKPPDSSSINDSKSSTNKPDKTGNSDDATDKPPSTANNKDQVHISFDGVSTVNDLFDRIDDAVENANIIIKNGPDAIDINILRTSSASPSSVTNLEKKSTQEVEQKNKEEDNKDEPIHINYNEIHTLEDILSKITGQPEDRQVLLENTPINPDSITDQKQINPPSNVPLRPSKSIPSDAPLSSTGPTENDDQSASTKSILKTSQDPSSLDTSTKTSAFQDDHIHVNIDGAQVVNNLLDRAMDEAIHSVPTIINSQSSIEKRKAPKAPTQNEPVPRISQKREAPKPPSSTNDHDKDSVHTTASESSNSTESTDKEGKGDGKDSNDWI